MSIPLSRFTVGVLLVVTGALPAAGARAPAKAAPGKPTTTATAPTTAPAKAGAGDVVQVAFAMPAGFVGETKPVGTGWAGGWTSPENVNLVVSISPRPAPGRLALDRAVKASVPMMVAKACPGMKISDAPVNETFAGHPFLGHRLSGTSKTGPLAGMAGLADVESATITLVAYGPEKAFDTAWPGLLAAMKQMKVTQPAAAGAPATRPATRPASAGGVGGGAVADAKPFVFGHYTFTPPGGWAVKQEATRVILVPAGGNADNPAARLTLLSPVALKGASLADWLATFTDAAHKEAAVRQKRDPKPAGGPGGQGVITQVFVIQARGASRVEYRVYAAMAAGENVQAILFAAPEATDFQAYLPDLQRLIETAQPVKPAEP